MLHIYAALAEKERRLISERTGQFQHLIFDKEGHDFSETHLFLLAVGEAGNRGRRAERRAHRAQIAYPIQPYPKRNHASLNLRVVVRRSIVGSSRA